MAFLKQTWVSGNLHVTGSENYISSSEFRGPLTGTASWAVSASEAVHALSASFLDPNANLTVKTLDVSGSAVVGGDLKVMGDLTYVGVKDLRVKDKQIELNTNDSGSAVAGADGAGIIIKNSDAEGDITITYSKTGDKLVFNKPIDGTIFSASEAAHAVSASRADSAANADSADKVKYALKFGTGLSASANYDGSSEVNLAIDEATLATIKVNSASNADTASQVANALTIVEKHSGSADTSASYNGSAAETVNVDFSGVETDITSHSASIADIYDILADITGGSGSIADQIEEAIEALDADASANAAGTPVSGGVFVLSGVAFNEADGKLTSGSATSVEVEKAGAAAAAVAALSQSVATDFSASAAALNDLSSSVATDFSASDAARVALSSSLSESIASVASSSNDNLNLVESSSYIAVSAKSNQKQTISAKTANVASASATGTDGLAVASDVKEYVDAQVGSKNVTAEGDEFVSASATNNKVTVETNVKLISQATNVDDGLATAYDVKSHVSSSVASLSSSIATSFSSSNARLTAVEATASANSSSIADLQSAANNYVSTASFNDYTSSANGRLDALETASGSAISRLNALETASATHVAVSDFNTYTASQALVDATQSARLDALESGSGDYVLKAGDSMSGDLNMGTNGVIFGNLKMVWNATSQAIEFVTLD